VQTRIDPQSTVNFGITAVMCDLLVQVARKKHLILTNDSYGYQTDRVYKERTRGKCELRKAGCKARANAVGESIKCAFIILVS